MKRHGIALGVLGAVLCGSVLGFGLEKTWGDPYVLQNVPAYNWYHGCGPTAAASIIGYYDLLGCDNLFDASGWNEVKWTANVKDQISSPEHNAKYDPDPDDSSLPTPPKTSIADWFQTSVNQAYGSSYQSKADNALEDYAKYRGYSTANSWYERYGFFTWSDLVGQIDAGRPMMFLVDSAGDGGTDHFVPVIGYDDRGDAGKYYACYTTWTENETVNWHQFRGMSSDYTWGVAYGTYFTIPFTPANNAPVAENDSFSGGVEDEAFTISAAGVLTNDTDHENDPLTAFVMSDPAHGTVSLDSNGGFTYTPDENFYGIDRFTYRADDGSDESNTALVQVEIAPVNDAPVAVDDFYTTEPGVLFNVALRAGVLANDTDADNTDFDTAHDDTLTVSLESGPAHGDFQWGSAGWFKYYADADFEGTDRFTYRVFDGTVYSDLATVWIDVVAPVQVPGDATGDGRVDEADAAVLASNWGKSGMEWSAGDFNDDGSVNAVDAAILAANWGYVAVEAAEASTVPEPGMVVTLLLGALMLVVRRGR